MKLFFDKSKYANSHNECGKEDYLKDKTNFYLNSFIILPIISLIIG